MTFSSWWKRPLTALGHARFVEGVGFPKLVARRFKRACCIRCSGSIPGTDRRWWRYLVARTHDQANKKWILDLTTQKVTAISPFRSHPDARSGVLAVKGSLRRAQNSAPLTAAGARHDHLVTSETVRVRHGK
jgi:hypothetical protein